MVSSASFVRLLPFRRGALDLQQIWEHATPAGNEVVHLESARLQRARRRGPSKENRLLQSRFPLLDPLASQARGLAMSVAGYNAPAEASNAEP